MIRPRTLRPHAIGCCLALAAAVPTLADDERASHQAIVQLEQGASIEEFNADHGTFLLGAIEGRDTYLIQLPEAWDEEEFEEQIEEDDDRVEDAQLNHRSEAAEGQTESFYLLVGPPEFEQQYTWEHVGLIEAHESTTGEGVVVAVLDTGIEIHHELFVGRLLEGAYDFVDDDADVSDVGNEVDDDEDGATDEMVGHGTFMAGIVARTAPDARLLIVRVLGSDGEGSSFRIAQGIYHAVAHGADVISLSMAMDAEHEILLDAIEHARSLGVVVVAAAGNLDREEPAALPAADPNVIGVAATGADDRKSAFSNYGEYVAISAPGSDVVSAVPGGEYARWEGTSISVALVSGASALVQSVAPGAGPEFIESTLRVTASDISAMNPDYEDALGAGRLDVGAAIASLVGDPPLGDLNDDRRVDTADLLILLGAWGTSGSPADLDESGVVDFGDVMLLMANWT